MGSTRLNLATPGALVFALLILLSGIWVYWPGVTGPDLLDDRSSVMVIGDLQSRPELAWDYIFGDRSGLLGRSVSMSSFVLEKLYLNEGTVGAKKVNIVLHAVNAALVIWLFWLLFRFQRVPGYRGLAVLLGAIWLLHPLLVSTVLYVVQRMAMLSTFFMLLASVAYVYWRVGLIAGKAGVWRFLPVPVFFMLAMFSKENAIVLIPVLLLLEVLWFECVGRGGDILRWLQKLSYGLIITGALGLASILVLRWDALAARLSRRPFSLVERLLTESRIVWDYVGQWLLPDVGRMGLYHDDVALSHSLTEPGITLYAVLGWLLLVLVSVVLLRWRGGRWLVLGIAWFVLGHSVESTVLPLELYFEHRNYYPVLGLLLALGVIVALVTIRWRQTAAPLLVFLGLFLVVVSAQTSSQVQIWSSRSLLLLNHVNAHPESPRANIDMAVELAGRGEIDAAHAYSRNAFLASDNGASTRERSGDYEVRDLALSCIANKPVPVELIDQLGAKDPGRPLSSVTTLLTMVRLLQDDACPEFDRIRFADRLAEIYLVEEYQRKGAPKLFSNLAVLENALQRYDKAFIYAERFLALKDRDKRGLLMKLHFATALGKTEAAEETLAILQELDEQGKLTVGEQQTMALYKENSD